MTEAEWFSVHDVNALLPVLREWASDRKLRLSACGCSRTSDWFMSRPGANLAVETAELWADGSVLRSDTLDAIRAIDVAANGPDYDFTRSAVELGLGADNPFIALQYTFPWVGSRASRDRLCSNLLRCVFGNPFSYDPAPGQAEEPIGGVRQFAKRMWRLAKELKSEADGLLSAPKGDFRPLRRQEAPRTVPRQVPKLQISVQPWLTVDVLALASQMYESRDFFAMPILADALQDAGCDNADILNHCRGPGPHVRGCWVVDLVLGKE